MDRPFLDEFEANVLHQLRAELLHKAQTCKNIRTKLKRWEQFHLLGTMLCAFQVIRQEKEEENDTP
jgi:hypothetical protein